MEYKADDLVTFSSFIRVFDDQLAFYHKANIKVTKEDIYNALNLVYAEKYGESRFSSYDAFRMARDRYIRSQFKKGTNVQ